MMDVEKRVEELEILVRDLQQEKKDLRDRDRVISHQLERRADGMDPLTQELRAQRDALEAEIIRLRALLDEAEHDAMCSVFEWSLCDCFKSQIPTQATRTKEEMETRMDIPKPVEQPATAGQNEALRARIDAGRASITALRDSARTGVPMQFRERDEHVMRLHRLLDELAYEGGQ